MPPRNYWLKEGCFFVQLDNPEGEFLSVVVDTNRRLHYTPTNDTAAYLLQLLVNQEGLSEEDLKANLVQHFNVTLAEAGNHLQAFLRDLEDKHLLASAPVRAVAAGPRLEAPRWEVRREWPERTGVVAGGTLVSLGRVNFVKNVYTG